MTFEKVAASRTPQFTANSAHAAFDGNQTLVEHGDAVTMPADLVTAQVVEHGKGNGETFELKMQLDLAKKLVKKFGSPLFGFSSEDFRWSKKDLTVMLDLSLAEELHKVWSKTLCTALQQVKVNSQPEATSATTDTTATVMPRHHAPSGLQVAPTEKTAGPDNGGRDDGGDCYKWQK